VLQLLNERERKILDLLIEDPHIGVSQMSKRLDVSSVTVRSDFDNLAEKGYIIRTRGGALPAFHPAILARQRNLPDRKAAIARAAAAFIRDGDSIMIEAGTTTAMIGRFLLGKRDVSVVTDSTLLLPWARSNPSVHFTFVGGIFRPEAESMMGPIAVQHLEQFHVKTAFLGTDGLSLENGLTSHMMEATEIVRAMHRRSDRTVLLADSSKWGQAGFARIIPLEEVDTLVIDSGLPESARKDIKALGIELLIVQE
jgi:DeoR family galactitol utilization operon repressor